LSSVLGSASSSSKCMSRLFAFPGKQPISQLLQALPREQASQRGRSAQVRKGCFAWVHRMCQS
jgi:hypothetical protein